MILRKLCDRILGKKIDGLDSRLEAQERKVKRFEARITRVEVELGIIRPEAADTYSEGTDANDRGGV